MPENRTDKTPAKVPTDSAKKLINVGIHCNSAHPYSLEVRDKEDNFLVVQFPVKITINPEGIFATLHVRLHELQLDGVEATLVDDTAPVIANGDATGTP